MRPRVGGFSFAPPAPTRGFAGANMEHAKPQFRWTFETWVRKSWHAWVSGYDGKRPQTAAQDRRTITVFAATEAEAKRKIEDAIPPVPPNKEGCSRDDDVTYERLWSLSGEVVEVER